MKDRAGGVGSVEMAELITLPRATVQQALEAMEDAHNLLPGMYDKHIHGIKQRHFNAIAALKAALEQPEHEPLTDTYVQEVPDKCDRIVWRGYYFHLPVDSTSKPEQPEQDTDCHAQGICQRSGYGIKQPGQEPDRWGEGYEAGYAAGMAEMKPEQAEPDAYGYASRLAVAIWEKHYKATAANWKPLPDLMGVLTQIDNMTAGLTRQHVQQEQEQGPVAFADQISFDQAMAAGKGHDVWPKAGDYKVRTGRKLRALYTYPPRREWRGLSEEEIKGYKLCGLVRDVEAKLKEKNHG